MNKFQESYNKFKQVQMHKRIDKVKSSYSEANSYFEDLETILKELETEFQEETTRITYSHEYFLPHSRHLFENLYSPFIKKVLFRVPIEMNFQNTLQLTTILFNYYESFLQNLHEVLEPEIYEEQVIQNFMSEQIETHLELINPNIFSCLEVSYQAYMRVISSRIKDNFQAKIKFKEANERIQTNNTFKNIDLNSNVSNFLEDYNLLENITENVEEVNRLILPRLEESFQSRSFSRNIDEKNSLLSKDQIITKDQVLTKELIFLQERGALDESKLLKSSESRSLKEGTSMKSDAIPFLDLTNYNSNDSVPLNESIKAPNGLVKYIKKENLQIQERDQDKEDFDSLLPSRISSFMVKFINQVDNYGEIMIKYQETFGYERSFMEHVVNFLLRIANSIQEKVLFLC